MKNDTKKELLRYLNEFNLINFESHIEAIIEKVNSFEHYNKILTCGNGGSASDATHIVGELMKSFKFKRDMSSDFRKSYESLYGSDDILMHTQGTIRSISLTSENALITAIGNDIGYDYVFSQQVYGYGDPNDLLFAFSTSGNSQSVINACKVAKAKGITVVGFTGQTGGNLKTYTDILFNVNEIDTFRVQQIHEILYHIICITLEIERF